MKIGILGKGIVGSACGRGFKKLGHDVIYHDPKLHTDINIVKGTDIVFVCVPTPNRGDQSCDITLVENSICDLSELNYQGVIAIKSTVPPGSTQKLQRQFLGLDICCVPEFLREHCAYADFMTNHRVLAVGCDSDRVWNTVIDCHAEIPKHRVRMRPCEAEILKYVSNTFNALRVVFANVMHDVCHHYHGDYDHVINTYLLRQTASPDYMKCQSDLRGYGGLCLPKDVRSMISICQELQLPYNLFQAIDHDNQCVNSTVFPGMRQEKN